LKNYRIMFKILLRELGFCNVWGIVAFILAADSYHVQVDTQPTVAWNANWWILKIICSYDYVSNVNASGYNASNLKIASTVTWCIDIWHSIYTYTRYTRIRYDVETIVSPAKCNLI
jgi:hypothetical protein